MEFAAFDLTQPQTGRPHADVYKHLLEQVRIAEAGGLAAYYLAEHHFDPHYSVVPSPNVLLGALALQTQRLRLGTMTTVLPYHHPVRVAEEARELDLLTGGRLELSFGRGAIRLEQIGWGVPRSESEARFDAALALVRELLVHGHIDAYDTPWWKGGAVSIVPGPTQLPHPPIWLAAVSETSSYKAGALGLHLATVFRDNAERTLSLVNYRRGWDEFAHANRGVSIGKVSSLHHTFVADTRAEARKWAQHHIEGWLSHFLKIISDRVHENEDPSYATHRIVNEKLLNSSFDQLIEDGRMVFGTPDDCVEQLERIAASGVDVFQGYFQFGELDYEASNRSLKLFCSEVLPRVYRSARPVAAS